MLSMHAFHVCSVHSFLAKEAGENVIPHFVLHQNAWAVADFAPGQQLPKLFKGCAAISRVAPITMKSHARTRMNDLSGPLL